MNKSLFLTNVQIGMLRNNNVIFSGGELTASWSTNPSPWSTRSHPKQKTSFQVKVPSSEAKGRHRSKPFQLMQHRRRQESDHSFFAFHPEKSILCSKTCTLRIVQAYIIILYMSPRRHVNKHYITYALEAECTTAGYPVFTG